MRRRKHFITLICLIIGMLVLTTAVYANYDDAKGYTNYKNALKQLAFQEKNFTAKYDAKVTVDGKELSNTEGIYKCADGNNSSYSKSKDFSNKLNTMFENYSYVQGEDYYSYDVKSNEYYQGKTERNKNGTLVPLDGETSKRAVRFAELLTDAIIGDLKNNVVLGSSENGIKKYSIHVSGNQIPEIVNAGLSLMFTSSNNSNYENEITSKFGNDPYIDTVTFKTDIDDQGRIVVNSLDATLVGVDKNGEKHTGKLVVNLNITDYNKTKVDQFDPAGKKLMQ